MKTKSKKKRRVAREPWEAWYVLPPSFKVRYEWSTRYMHYVIATRKKEIALFAYDNTSNMPIYIQQLPI